MHTKGEHAGKPFVLAPWEEQDIVRPLFGWKRKDGTRRYREAYIEIPKKNGKALDVETPLPTPEGWTTMGEIQVGDRVFDERGKPCRVSGTTEIMYGHDCYRVVFSDGSSVIADAKHEWRTTAYRTGGTLFGTALKGLAKHSWRRKPEDDIRTTEQLRDTLLVESPSNRRRSAVQRNHRVDPHGPLETQVADLPIPPYALGCWLGDGHSDCARLTVGRADQEMLEHLRVSGVEASPRRADRGALSVLLRLPRPAGRCRRGHELAIEQGSGHCRACERATDYARRHGLPVPARRHVTLHEELRGLGVLGDKHIPAMYLRSSIVQRTALLQGLMDTDGTCARSGQCEFTTTKSRLRDGVLELLHSLGFKVTCAEFRARLRGRDCGPAWRLGFFPFRDRPVFKLARKCARQKERPVSGARDRRQILAVEPTASVPVRCIEVDSPSHLYLAGRGMVPTHNSTLAAGLALFLLLADGEMGAEVYGAAGDKDQARIVFNDAKLMRAASPELRKRSRAFKDSIVAHATASFYRVLSSDAPTKHGLNSHAVVFDELHVQPDRELWDTMYGGGAARRQPLTLSLTTAGHDRRSICWEKHDYALKVLDGSIVDPAFLAVIYAAAETDDWRSEATWRKANPNLEVSVKIDFLRDLAKKAEESLAFLNTFKRLHLDIWTESITRWLPPERWQACGGAIDVAALAGRRCFGGLDLSTTTDITAFVLLFPPETPEERWALLAHFWCPEAAVGLRARRDRVPYDVWVQQRVLKATAGDVVDYDAVRADIRQLATTYRIQEIAYDRWNASQLVTQLQEDGALMVPFGQGFASMSAPTKDLEKLVVGEKLRHGDHPVLGWMAANVVIAQDAADNWKPTKAKSTGRIDGIVAAIMALGRAMTPPAHPEPRISVLG